MGLNGFDFSQMFRLANFVRPSAAEQLADSFRHLVPDASAGAQLAGIVKGLVSEPSPAEQVASSFGHLVPDASAGAQLAGIVKGLVSEPSPAEQVASSFGHLVPDPSAAAQLAGIAKGLVPEPSTTDKLNWAVSARLTSAWDAEKHATSFLPGKHESAMLDKMALLGVLPGKHESAMLDKMALLGSISTSHARTILDQITVAAAFPSNHERAILDKMTNSVFPSGNERFVAAGFLKNLLDGEASALVASTRLQFKSHGGALWGQGALDFDAHEILKAFPSRAERRHGVTRILEVLDELAETAPREDVEPIDQRSQSSRSELNEPEENTRSESRRSQLVLVSEHRIVRAVAKEANNFAPIRLFVGAVAQDRELKDALLNHISLLRRQGLIATWHEGNIAAGSDWEAVLSENFRIAQIVLLLVSADFIANKFYEGMDRAFEEKHRSGIVMPVLVRDVDLTDSIFDKIHPLNRRPVARSTNQDQAWTRVARKIRAAVATIRRKATGSLS